MKILTENSEKIVIEMSKFDFNNLRNIFILNKIFCDEDLDKNEYDVAEKIVYLEDTDKITFVHCNNCENNTLDQKDNKCFVCGLGYEYKETKTK